MQFADFLHYFNELRKTIMS